MQVSILSDTVEAMQSTGEAEQRVATLCARLSESEAVGARLGLRVKQLQLQLEAKAAHGSRDAQA